MRVLKALAALLLLMVLLVGTPALLLAWGQPLALLAVQWSTALLRPDDGTILLGVLSVAGWLAWAVVASTSVAEIISHLSRQRVRIRLPGVSWLQPVVGALVSMALLPVLSVRADEPVPPVAVHASFRAEKSADSPVKDSAGQAWGTREYEVQPGDELWGVAENELGSGPAWRTILRCNPGMTTDTSLVPGTTILLPEEAPAAAAGTPARQHQITVRRGDTLWGLAEEHLGDPHRWPELYAANRDIIADPDEIDIGWQLSVPPPPGPEEAELRTSESPSTVSEESDQQQTGRQAPDTDDPAGTHEDATPPSALPTTPTVTSDTSPDAAPSPALPSTSGTAATPGVAPSTSAPASTTNDTVIRPSQPPPPHAQEREDSGTSLELLGHVGGVLAASLVAGVVARRHVQLLQREVGRRISTLTPSLQRFFSALVRRSDTGSGTPVELPSTSVIVGWDDSRDILIDVEEERCTLLTGADEHAAGMAATVLTSLLCAEWSAAVEVVAVQPHEDWSTALDDPRLSSQTSFDAALAELQRLCAQRRIQLGHSDITTVRTDEDRADAWAPVVFVFCQPLHPGHVDRIRDCLSLGRVGVSVVAATQSAPVDDSFAVLHIASETKAQLGRRGGVFQPQLLSGPARHAVISLFASALDEQTEPAPWWRDGDEEEVTVLPNLAEEPIKDDAMPAWSPTPDHPTLLVLGPVALAGTHGERPTRAVGQCMEYCAWLLLKPGSTPTAMVRELLVAEGTRRSNMSRLRTWLGNDLSDNPYLPDAYSGHIALAPAVTSDWERFQSLLAGGVNRSSTPLLKQALSLVRGRPLDGMAFQWPWASQWLTDMLSMITDASVMLADRCFTEQDYDGALWAIGQGQLATGDDETLAVRRIQILAQTGDKAQVDAAITHLTRAARAQNRDLAPESIQRIQHALHLTTSRSTGS